MQRICFGCMQVNDSGSDTCPHCGYVNGTMQPEPYHMAAGTVLHDRYLVGRVLGFGGFGVTYIGYDVMLRHTVAIKEYLPGEFSTRMPGHTRLTVYSGDKEEQFMAGKDKFLEESRKLIQFQNIPEIVHVFDCFEENDTAYIIMEYLEGQSLKAKLDHDGRMPIDEALPIILDVLHALEAVHKKGILHRDVAPDNIFLTKEGQVKLIDFGAARYATTTHSRSLTVLIKPGFAPEEQYRSRGDQGPWTDVYATAATLYKMITGITPDDALERSVNDRLKVPSRLHIKIGRNIENALMNALNVKVEGRTESAERFEEELMASVVKRVVVKKQRIDIGRWPLWIKAVILTVVAAAVTFVVLLRTGVIHFDTQHAGEKVIEQGLAYVPNIVNQDVASAQTILEAMDLRLQITDKQYSAEIPENRVLSQDVESGCLVETGSSVQVVMSAGIERTDVPYVLGMSRDDAVAALKDAGLVVTETSGEYRMAPGTIATQSIDAGTEVDTGTGIEILVSDGIGGGDSGVQEIMDDVTGLSFEEAVESELAKYIYLINSDSEYSDDVPEGCIISQDVASGEAINQNSNVNVVVSLGQELIKVPDVQYKSQAEATDLLTEAGFQVTVKEEESATVEKGNVIRQDPEQGEKYTKDTEVTIYISTGAPKTESKESDAQKAAAKAQADAQAKAKAQADAQAKAQAEADAAAAAQAQAEADAAAAAQAQADAAAKAQAEAEAAAAAQAQAQAEAAAAAQAQQNINNLMDSWRSQFKNQVVPVLAKKRYYYSGNILYGYYHSGHCVFFDEEAAWIDQATAALSPYLSDSDLYSFIESVLDAPYEYSWSEGNGRYTVRWNYS